MYLYRYAPKFDSPSATRSCCLTRRVSTEHWYCANNRGILPWTHARWSEISRVCPREVCEHRHGVRRCAARPRGIPQASHPRKVDTTVRCSAARDHWKSIPHYWLDPDVIWSDRVYGLLQRWPFGTMSGALHHGTGFDDPDSAVLCRVVCLLGKRLHRLRYPHVHSASRW